MDTRLLRLYEEELRYLREMGGEFAHEYPKVAGRLGLDGFECADPYVERLLEGVAFLTARIQLKLAEAFPDFTRNLMDVVHPQLACPVPSMAVVELEPDLSEGALAEGFPVPRGTALRSVLGKGEKTACEYRTAHPITLWPLRITNTRYLPSAGAIAADGLPVRNGARAALKLQFEVTAGARLADLALDTLPVFLRSNDETSMWLYEQIFGACVGYTLRGDPAQSKVCWLPATKVRQIGFDAGESLLPPARRSFDGYRLVQEYFALPQRFLFFEIGGMAEAIAALPGARLEITLHFNRAEARLEHAVQPEQFRLFASPAVNLFPMTTDRIHLNTHDAEFHVVPDRNRPMDFEVYCISSVTGYGRTTEDTRVFHPFYHQTHHLSARAGGGAYFSVQRRPRERSSRQRRQGTRTTYLGSECFVSLVDSRNAPFSIDLRQLEVQALCSNRDLPLQMARGKGTTDFTMGIGAPVQAVRVVAGPTRPRDAFHLGETAWRLVSQLSLNYLSIADADSGSGTEALREMLALYVDENDPLARHVKEGVVSVSSSPVARRMPVAGPICFGNGLKIRLRLDETPFTGVGAFLLGAVLDRFFAKYVTINSFTQTVVESEQRGEIMRWPVRAGQRLTL